jgi:carbamoyl-phosphate synthase small subunit
VRNFTSENYGGQDRISLLEWLRQAQIPVLADVDTRALISHIRKAGVMMSALATDSFKKSQLLAMATRAPTMSGQQLSQKVSVKEPYIFFEGEKTESPALFRVVVIDFGAKFEILRCLRGIGAEVIVVPKDLDISQIMALNPDGICLSNGPGDPKTETVAINSVQKLLGKIPIFGICLGHQILGQAIGYESYKLKCGHRGSNQPVMSQNGQVIITAQNHGFAIEADAAQKTHECDYNLNDNTNEGIDIPELKAFSVQFHPEGAPGPKDAYFYFERFASLMKTARDFNEGRIKE